MRSKYGTLVTDASWPGLPIREGHMAADGSVNELYGECDSILVWTGGVSHVSIAGSKRDVGGGRESSVTLVRRSGYIDLLPRGTSIARIHWHGEASRCLAVNLPESHLIRWFGDARSGLDGDMAPRYGLVDPHVVDLTLRLKEQAESGVALGAAYVQSLSCALAAYVSKRYGANPSRSAPSKFGVAKRNHLESFIARNLGSDVGVVDMAAQVGYSADHFIRLFRQEYGTTPHRYLLGKRVEQARALLRDPSSSIVEIALACGFASQAHFSVTFKRHTGYTPGEYRKQR